jgi:dethiobiotin synthetase
MKYRNLYIAASSQHVGKTTSTLGLVTAFQRMGIQVGYCKPVGQKFVDVKQLRVDKDALLFSNVMHFPLDHAIHSPVILGPGATASYLDHPEKFDYRERICYASSVLQASNELVIFEGTGHPGVGSIVGLSNADVAEMLDAAVVLVVEGGIGSTVDMLGLCLARFRKNNIPIVGVIINKVHEDRTEKVRHYVGGVLDKLGIPLLGILPYDQSMILVLIKTVVEAIDGIVIYNEDRLYNKVQDIVAGSLIDKEDLKGKDLLLVVSAMRVDAAIEKLEFLSHLVGQTESPLSGIIATGHGAISDSSIEYIKKHRIPLIRTSLDTYGSVLKISRIEVKINKNTPWKVNRAIEMIEKNVDLSRLLQRLD